MADGKVVIDIILNDGTVAKGVANLDKSLVGVAGSGQTAALGIGKNSNSTRISKDSIRGYKHGETIFRWCHFKI